MIRVALKGLPARPVRTALTTLAIVLGVALVVRRVHAHRHDARRGRHALRAAYDGTDAVVTRQDGVQARPTTATPARSRRSPPGRSTACARVPRRRRRRRRHHRPRPRSSAPTASRSATARTSASASTPRRGRRRGSRRSGSTRAAGPPGRGEVVIDAATAEQAALRVGDTSASPPAARRAASASSASRRFGRVKSLGTASDRRLRPARRAGAVRQGRALRPILVAGARRRAPRRRCAATLAAALPQRQVQTGAPSRTASRSTG